MHKASCSIVLVTTLALALTAAGCSSTKSEAGGNGGTTAGGSGGNGGQTTVSSGGTAGGSGGGGTGGQLDTGAGGNGGARTGGTTGSGGVATGGSTSGGASGIGTGGAAATGGMIATGGKTGTGGTSASGGTGGGAGTSGACATGQTSCNGSCVDTNSSPGNCGGCGKVCASGQVCSAGNCSAKCATGEYLCDQACVNLSTSTDHCGDCSKTCGSGQSCSGGVCTCPSGQLFCSQQCISTSADQNNCGNCGVKCSSAQSCSGGKCVCNAGMTQCGTDCYDFKTDANHCGSCDNQCLIGATCSAGACKNSGSGAGKVFGACRFHFGEDHAQFKSSPQAEVEYVTAWAGSSEDFNLADLFTDCKAGGVAAGRLPVMYGYIIAFTARRDQNLQDCNVTSGASLCTAGAAYIRDHFTDRILAQYKKYATGVASAWGTTNPVLWLMEPDYYQYASDSRQSGGPLTFQQAGDYMHQIVTAIKAILPNSVFSMDISPWMSATDMTQWYAALQMGDFAFMNTSAGATLANSSDIRAGQLTWAQVYNATQKPIIADASYGGSSQPHDANWDSATNLNARIADGVTAISHVVVPSNWSSTITSLRSQLGTPAKCP